MFLYYIKPGDMYTENGKKNRFRRSLNLALPRLGKIVESTSTNSFKYGVRPISIRTHAFRRGGEIPMPVMLETLLINLRRKFSNSEK